METAVKAIKSGANDYLEKPLNKDKLFLTLNNTLEKILLKKRKYKAKKKCWNKEIKAPLTHL